MLLILIDPATVLACDIYPSYFPFFFALKTRFVSNLFRSMLLLDACTDYIGEATIDLLLVI
tara:strand:- start:1040 stop:1222 length:183 start_codon:yes stop_codon:yes gene_type:complete